jgi:hypothetical protein
MTISGLPVAGSFRPPPGRVLGHSNLGSIGFPAAGLGFPAAGLGFPGAALARFPGRGSMRGLGTMTDVCDNPATAIMTALSSGIAAGFAAQGDVGWQQAGTGVRASTEAFNAACTAARTREAAGSSAPGDAQTAAALAQIQALTQAQQYSQAQLALTQAQQSEQIMGLDKPVFYGGAAVLGLLALGGLYLAFRKRR